MFPDRSLAIENRESRVYIHIHMSREVVGSHYASQRTAESFRFLSFPRDSLSRLFRFHLEGDLLGASRNISI